MKWVYFFFVISSKLVAEFIYDSIIHNNGAKKLLLRLLMSDQKQIQI